MGLEGRRVLFISYNGMLDPLGQTQVLPYLRSLASRGVEFTLLSFERNKAFEPEGLERTHQLRSELLEQGIDWRWLRYHQTPSIPATTYDVFAGVRFAKALVQEKRIELAHARSHIPATIALALKRNFGIKMIFDLRGLLAEEYVDAEHWRKNGLPYRVTKLAERLVLRETDAIVTLTRKIWPIIKDWDGLRGRDVHHAVIPCCVDLKKFSFNQHDREVRRVELGLDQQFTLVYSGSIDGWYLTEKMVDFFASFSQNRTDSHLLWLTNGSHERITQLMLSRNIQAANFSIKSVAADLVPSYLSAADTGLAFIKPCFSKLASSPTKNGEYLACGLPLVINSGIGDSDALVEEYKAGVLIKAFTGEEYAGAAASLAQMSVEPDLRSKMRSVAAELFDLETVGIRRYADLYERVLSS
jgi:glycosyltransferase involved in cell wall biosynthesis